MGGALERVRLRRRTRRPQGHRGQPSRDDAELHAPEVRDRAPGRARASRNRRAVAAPRSFRQELRGLKTNESAALFQLLQERVVRLENTLRWAWAPGDLVIWDNRATQHYGIADFGTHKRSVHRVTLAGDVPVSVDGDASRILTGDASHFSVVDTPDRFPGFDA
ncbi:hypothetical protein GS421_16030 [Rhodococcus hoagii]|nr:hypothetical protein [Prescottella equi]